MRKVDGLTLPMSRSRDSSREIALYRELHIAVKAYVPFLYIFACLRPENLGKYIYFLWIVLLRSVTR